MELEKNFYLFIGGPHDGLVFDCPFMGHSVTVIEKYNGKIVHDYRPLKITAIKAEPLHFYVYMYCDIDTKMLCKYIENFVTVNCYYIFVDPIY